MIQFYSLAIKENFTNLKDMKYQKQAEETGNLYPEGLTPEELKERDKLRRIYIDSVKANLVGQLENTYIVRPDGTKEKVEKKK